MIKEENIKQGDIYLRKAKKEDLLKIKEIVYRTIDISYENIYSKKAIDFFKEHHSVENIEKDLKNEFVVVLKLNNEIIGTGTLAENEVGRVFVIPKFQNEGFGKEIMKDLERKAVIENIRKIKLDASLVAYEFYKSLGYKKIKEEVIEVGEGEKLNYIEMRKKLN